MIDITGEIGKLEAEVSSLRLKSQSDDATIALLKQQNNELTQQIDKCQSESSQELRRLKKERDDALTKSTQVTGIIKSICELGLEGLNRLQQTVQDTVAKEDHSAHRKTPLPPLAGLTPKAPSGMMGEMFVEKVTFEKPVPIDKVAAEPSFFLKDD